MVESSCRRPGWLLWLAVVAVAVVYAPGFGGFWHGDDLPNLHRAYAQSEQGTLWRDTFRLFAEPVPSQGSFYRPMMMLSLAVNYVLADANYAGWYLVNFVVHLSNTLLLALVIRRLAEHHACDATLAAPLAALLFGLCPAIAEGVYWVSARSDGWVALLSLTSIYFWSGSATSRWSAFALPLLLIPALGFKESAAVLPLQMVLLAVVRRGPLSRSQRGALVATFVVAGLFLVWRAFLFGDAWHVYPTDGSGSTALYTRLWTSILSIGPWWTALGQATPVLSKIYVSCCVLGILLATLAGPLPQWRLAMALTAASGGLALATVLNVGAMSALGEGGRLSYGPVMWLALAVGVLLSRPRPSSIRLLPPKFGEFAILLIAVLASGGMLWEQLRAVNAAQASMRAIAQAIAPWAENHPGITLLVVPENDGAVVLARNAQAGMVLEPIQKTPHLHRVLPALARDIELLQDYLCRGMLQRIEIVRPRFFDASTMASILQPAQRIWPKHLACWSRSQQKILPLPTPPMDSTCSAWLTSVRTDSANCER